MWASRGGTSKRLNLRQNLIMGALAWTRTATRSWFSSTRGGLGALWRVPASGGTPRPVAGVGVVCLVSCYFPKGISLRITYWPSKIAFFD